MTIPTGKQNMPKVGGKYNLRRPEKKSPDRKNPDPKEETRTKEIKEKRIVMGARLKKSAAQDKFKNLPSAEVDMGEVREDEANLIPGYPGADRARPTQLKHWYIPHRAAGHGNLAAGRNS
jgi:hypothetical protein